MSFALNKNQIFKKIDEKIHRNWKELRAYF